MAKRSSGCVNVSIVWVDRTSQYRAVVSSPEGREVVLVGAPRVMARGVDHPDAYDAAARAAISFAGDAHVNHAAWGGNPNSGLKISRRAAPAACKNRRRR